MPRPEPLDPARVELAQIALFLGQRADEAILEQLEKAGFPRLRPSHGYVVQHLVSAPRSVGELAVLLGITQQGASKLVGEMQDSGYVEDVPSTDARRRIVRLSARGRAVLQRARQARARFEKRLSRKVGPRRVRGAKEVVLAALDLLGGLDEIRQRRVRDPQRRR